MFDINKTELHKMEGATVPNEFECYSVSEVAKLLKVKKPFVYELIQTHKLKSIRFSERRIRIEKSALREFLKQEFVKPIVYNKNVQPPRRGRKPKIVS